MIRCRAFLAALIVAVWFAAPLAAAPIVLDDFEDGSTESWFAGGGPFGAVPPFPPANVPTGGPSGADDNFLSITAVGFNGPGSRLVAMNATQWALNYVTAGITRVEMDVINLGNTALSLRLLFEDPIPGPPQNVAFSADPIVLAAGSGWTHISFPISPSDLIAQLGDAATALSQTTILRLFHSTAATFPGESIVATLGVDNISASASVSVPEPSTALLSLLGMAVFRLRRTRARAEHPDRNVQDRLRLLKREWQ